MKFSSTKERLQKALRSVSGVAGRNPTLPVLRNILLQGEQGRLRITTTDLEVGIVTWIIGKQENDEVSVTIPLKQLLEYVQNLPNDHVHLTLDTTHLTISCGGARASFQGESAENFPLIPTVEEGIQITLPAEDVARALDRTLYAAATDDTRPELAGVLLAASKDVLILAATDSYRLSESRVHLSHPLKEDLRAIVPLRAAHELRRVLEGEKEATLLIGESQLRVETSGTHLVSRRIEGTYPDYAQIIPQHPSTTVSLLRHNLTRAVRGAGVFSSGDTSSILLEATTTGLRVTAATQELGDTMTDVPAEVQGEPVSIHFNPRFLLDALATLPSERITLGLTNPATPALVRPEGTEREQMLGLVMPIKT